MVASLISKPIFSKCWFWKAA